ncbi:MAG: hypothetical protein AB1705_20755 [Verrucomicrobiota bacterium]
MWIAVTALATVAFAVFQLFIMVPLVRRLFDIPIPGLAVGMAIVLFGAFFFAAGDRLFARLGVRLVKPAEVRSSKENNPPA